jgi:F-type H+-transporting ATPase subunit b
MDILSQLGGLMLGAVPTAILFILLVIAYRILVERPLVKALEDRRARTSGAMEQARTAIAAAEQETSAYEERLRAARSEILAAREFRVKQWQAERDAALQEARVAAQERIQSAKQEIEQMSVTARRQIEEASAQLGEQIMRAVLPSGASLSEAQR